MLPPSMPSSPVWWPCPSLNPTALGAVVLLFAPAPNSEDSPEEIGKFPLDPCTVTTFELYLTIQADTAVGTRVRETLTNFVRKIGGKPTQVHIDPKFKLIKKKLYRSST